MRTLRAYWSGEDGATSIEYALIAGFVSLALILGATTIGTRLNARYYTPVSNGLS